MYIVYKGPEEEKEKRGLEKKRKKKEVGGYVGNEGYSSTKVVYLQ